MPKTKRGPRQDSSRKSSTASPELTRKSPEPSSSISPPPPAQPVAQEPPMEEADEDGGSWQEAKPRTRGSKKKGEQRNAPERQQPVNDRQQRRKDADKKGPRVKPFSGPSNQKAAPEKPAESSTPQPPPVISYKDRLLGKKEEKRTPEPVTGVASAPVAAHVAAAHAPVVTPAPVAAPVAATPVAAPAHVTVPTAVKKPELPVAVAKVEQEVVKVVVKPEKETVVVAEASVERAKEKELKPEPKVVVVSKPVKVEEEKEEEKEVEVGSKPEPEEIKPEVAEVKEVVVVKEKIEQAAELVVAEENKEELTLSVPCVVVEPGAEPDVEPEVEEKPVKVEEKSVKEEVKSDTVEVEPEPKAKVMAEEQIPAQKLTRSTSLQDLDYLGNQWSPKNQTGEKRYGSNFLRKLQNVPTSMKLPENVNLPKHIAREAGSHDIRQFGGGPPSFMPYGKENNLMPSFANPTPRREIRRMQDGSGPKIIKSISLSADVKLNESENAWKPTPRKPRDEDDASEKEDLLKKVRSVLNKLTPEKFEKLLGQVKEMKIDTKDKLEGVINLIFLKAIDEPGFCQMYANMCHELSTYVRLRCEDDAQTVISFKKLLIQRCQQEYEKQHTSEAAEAKKAEMLAKIQEAQGNDKKDLEMELEEIERKKRVRYVGVNRFIAELYKKSLLTPMIMRRCIMELLKERSEEALECLCKIITTIGKDLEAKDIDLRAAFTELKLLIVNKSISTRVRFMMQDVVELKLRNWVPRKEADKPKTMEEIAHEAKMEAEALPPPSSMPPANMGNHRTPSRGHDRDRDRDRDRQNERSSGRNTSSRPVKVDLKKLALAESHPGELNLGRPATLKNWQSGSSVSSSVTRPNLFSVLGDSSGSDMDGPNNNLPMSKQSHRL
ncbi:eukaryotic translation initiation factor 4 gamma 1-like isoform X2 [Cloeon dipterum]